MFNRRKIKFFSKTKNFNNIFITFLFILTFILIVFSKTDYFIVYKIKSYGLDIITPTSNFISAPVKVTLRLVNQIDNLRNVQKENMKLKEEIIRLKKWQILAIKNIRENKAYKKLLNSNSSDELRKKTAIVTLQSPNIYSKTINVNAGLDDQIQQNYAVINERGLVGKIISVSNKNSKVLLINDNNSSIPVKIMGRDYLAIVNGSPDGKFLISSFTKDDKKPKIGDILVTSGNANIFPKDVLVGKIVRVTDKNFIALPFVNLQNLEFVQIVYK